MANAFLVNNKTPIDIVQGDCYYNADERALTFSITAPALDGADTTVWLELVKKGESTVSIQGVVSNYGDEYGGPKTVYFELAADDTAGLTTGTRAYRYHVTCYLDKDEYGTPTHPVTPEIGYVTVWGNDEE